MLDGLLARLRRTPWGSVVAGVLVAFSAYLGGIAATNLVPTTVETTYYQASVRLSLAPDSTIEVPSVLGDFTARFESAVPAPGIVVDTSVREEIADAFVGQSVTPDVLRPTDEEVENALRAAVAGVVLRFLVGFLLVFAAALLLAARTRDELRRGWAAGTAVAVGLVAPSAASVDTYRPSNLGEVSATSLLGIAQQNLGALGDVEQRSVEASRYLSSALGVTRALQQKFTPPRENSPNALRVLFVSDVHGINQYKLLKSVVEDEDVDLVVDSGDLINFGRADEATAASLVRGIADLDVPYLFVRGNHDAVSRTDDALLRALDKAPNVVLLHPDRTHYTEVTAAGITFGGFNDPRYYGDGLMADPKAQEAARARFVKAFADRPLPDVIVGHEPGSVDGLNDTSLIVSGHVHVPGIDGNHLSVGTFTGGGLFGVRLEKDAEEGTEISTDNYSFDIASFDTTCSLSSVRRYTFSGILQGKPTLRSASSVNGSSLTPPVKERTCGGSRQARTASVPAPN